MLLIMPVERKSNGVNLLLYAATIVGILFVWFSSETPKRVMKSTSGLFPRIRPIFENNRGHNGRSEQLTSRYNDLLQKETVHYTSTRFDLEETSNGPILRVHHMSEKSRKNSTTFIAFGEGLSYASVGEVATFTIKATNFSVPSTIVFSALAVSDNHMFVADPLPNGEGSHETMFTYTPSMEGEYDFYIEELANIRGDQYQIPGSPFRLIVHGSKVKEEERRKLADALPSCQTIPQNNLSWVEGSWKTRKIVGSKHGVLRSGWVFQPKICSFDTFTTEELAIAAASSEPRSIIVLGSSTDRGIFLSLVDLILSDRQKNDFDGSDLTKCWGFAELQVGNLRIVYQDFRIANTRNSMFKSENNVTITCHNEKKVAQGYDFFDDAIAYLREFLFNDRLWPDVIFVSVGNSLQLKALFQVIPPSWKGVIYPTIFFGCRAWYLYTASGVERRKELAESFNSIDERIHILDDFALITGVRHGSEGSPSIMGSNHFHRPCNELGGSMKICGDATEMIAQVLLGKAIAPKGKDVWMKSVKDKDREAVQNMDSREIMVCHDCPQSLLPFHIKKIPDLKCYRSTQGLRPAEEKNFKVWDGTLCPSECMKTIPVGQAPTESGPVDVRECVVPLK
ncbi:hypothetical protein HOLleu_04302 [Holothuria leucospilota]|uniref:Uncharacterized protein n=1 Tax=Holothuria leucospilota TaxID=206669 RepID=A0A9Q1CU99_HOLLE|nr:hypothetical protein HOLleu_04302 [Holothuria leucospilota]